MQSVIHISRTLSKILFAVSLLTLVLIMLPRPSAAQIGPKIDKAAVSPAAPADASLLVPANDNFANAQVISTSLGNVISNSAGATKETGEPAHAGNSGGASVWYRWTATNPNSLGMTFTLRNSTTNFDTLLGVYTGASVNALTKIASNDDYGSTPGNGRTSTVFFPTVSGTTYYIAIDGFNGASGDFQLSWDVNRTHARANFGSSTDSAISVFRPSNGTWYINNTNTGFQAKQFGLSGDVPAAADFDGDGITDFAVFRPSTQSWYILLSVNNTFYATQFGASGDIPVPGDYNGDGYAELAVFRPSNGFWYNSVDGTAYTSTQFGLLGDKVVPRDYDGDGKLDLAVFRPSSGVWYIKNSFDNSFRAQQWGSSEDIPVPGEYQGIDGKADIAVWRPSNGTWYARPSYTTQPYVQQWGLAGDIPQPIAYPPNSTLSSFGIFRPSNGTWYILSPNGQQVSAQQFGLNGDIPVATAYPIQP